MHTSYWKDFGGEVKGQNTFIEKAKNNIDLINGDYWKNSSNLFINNTLSITFYDSVAVFEKGFYDSD